MIRLLPSATRTLLSPATARPPTEVSSPDRVPALPIARRKAPSGPKTCTTCEPWSPTYTLPSGPTATACGKRSTPPSRAPTSAAPVYGHDVDGVAPGQSAQAGPALIAHAIAASATHLRAELLGTPMWANNPRRGRKSRPRGSAQLAEGEDVGARARLVERDLEGA